MNVCVVGLGKIGLPLAVQIASKGHHVSGLDISDSVVDAVNSCRAPFPGEADLDERLRQVVVDGNLQATTDVALAVASSSVVIIVVPLVVDGEGVPDFGAMDAATTAAAAEIRPGTLVVYETTLPVGTTRTRFAPMIEGLSGLTSGVDLFVAHSPERVFSGRVFADMRAYPKLVGATDDESLKKAISFYESALDFDERADLEQPNGVWALSTVEEAEMAKLAETTYRDINIAFANELARFCDRNGSSVFDVIRAANSQPFSHIHRPGIAVGGHCIPVYPKFYLAGHSDAALPRAAREVNEQMPSYAVGKLESLVGGLEGLRVVVLGVAYRGGVKETAFSGAFGVVEAVKASGGLPVVHDPLYDEDELRSMGLEPYRFGEPCDAAVLQADHREYQNLDPGTMPGLRAILDGRGSLEIGPFLDAGIDVLRIGAPANA